MQKLIEIPKELQKMAIDADEDIKIYISKIFEAHIKSYQENKTKASPTLKSTSAIATEIGIPVKELFQIISTLELAIKEEETWRLLDKGASLGAKYKSSSHGKYIAWPPEVLKELYNRVKNNHQKY